MVVKLIRKAKFCTMDKGNIIRDGFNVEVTLNKDSNFEYKPSRDADSDDSKMDFILRLSNDISGKN